MDFLENAPLASLCSYRIGGPAKFYCEAKNAEEVTAAVALARRRKLPIFVLGGGTNILIDDRGFDGLVLRPAIESLSAENETVRAGAGVSMSGLLEFAAERGLAGLEWAGGLPGTLGGAIRGNAGAFGGEIKDSVIEVRSLRLADGEIVDRPAAECRFGYRSSVFKEPGGEIVLAAALRLKKDDPRRLRQAIEEKIKHRRGKHPLEYPNVGSVFKNVDLRKIPEKRRAEFGGVVKVDPFPVVPTAYLISEAGLKGVSLGGAMVSPKHPNFIVNSLGAGSGDVKNLIAFVKRSVEQKFGVKLEEEIQFIP